MWPATGRISPTTTNNNNADLAGTADITAPGTATTGLPAPGGQPPPAMSIPAPSSGSALGAIADLRTASGSGDGAMAAPAATDGDAAISAVLARHGTASEAFAASAFCRGRLPFLPPAAVLQLLRHASTPGAASPDEPFRSLQAVREQIGAGTGMDAGLVDRMVLQQLWRALLQKMPEAERGAIVRDLAALHDKYIQGGKPGHYLKHLRSLIDRLMAALPVLDRLKHRCIGSACFGRWHALPFDRQLGVLHYAFHPGAFDRQGAAFEDLKAELLKTPGADLHKVNDALRSALWGLVCSWLSPEAGVAIGAKVDAVRTTFNADGLYFNYLQANRDLVTQLRSRPGPQDRQVDPRPLTVPEDIEAWGDSLKAGESPGTLVGHLLATVNDRVQEHCDRINLMHILSPGEQKEQRRFVLQASAEFIQDQADVVFEALSARPGLAVPPETIDLAQTLFRRLLHRITLDGPRAAWYDHTLATSAVLQPKTLKSCHAILQAAAIMTLARHPLPTPGAGTHEQDRLLVNLHLRLMDLLLTRQGRDAMTTAIVQAIVDIKAHHAAGGQPDAVPVGSQHAYGRALLKVASAKKAAAAAVVGKAATAHQEAEPAAPPFDSYAHVAQSRDDDVVATAVYLCAAFDSWQEPRTAVPRTPEAAATGHPRTPPEPGPAQPEPEPEPQAQAQAQAAMLTPAAVAP